MTIYAPTRYDTVAKAFHWGMALAILALWVIGQMLEGMPKGEFKGQVIGVHKAVGVVLLVLTFARIAWRLGHPAPALPGGMPAAERTLAGLGHGLLYALMVALPIDGVLMSQTGGRAVSVFGFVLPTMIGKDEALHHAFEVGHAVMGWALAAVLLGHVAAALRHHLMLKDDVLTRMLPGRG